MKSILIVEDEESLRESLKLILEESKFEVDSVGDGKEAIEKLRDRYYDVVILDNNLPFIQGEDLIGFIKMHSFETQIILMSGNFDKDTVEQAKAKGVSLVVEKPFDYKIITQYLDFE